MKYDYTNVKSIYIICGKTDMRKGIDGHGALAGIIDEPKNQYKRDIAHSKMLSSRHST